MRKIMFLLTLSIMAATANAQTLSDCTQSAAQYGYDLSAPLIDENCKQIIIDNASDKAIDYSEDNSIQAFGAGNILHIIYYTLDINGLPVTLSSLLSGKFTLLNDIKAVKVDAEGALVYVLNQASDGNQNVVALKASSMGATATVVKLASDEILNATNIKPDRTNNDLYVVGNDWIKVFNIDAHYESNIPERSIEVKRTIFSSSYFQNIQDMTVVGNEIFVLDSDRVLVFERTASGDVLAIREINSVDFNGAHSIEYNSTDCKLHITNADGSVVVRDTL